jgi:hypothetical protein
MGGLFGGKNSAGREAEKQQETQAAAQYDEMVSKALQRLTRWAFPDSQVERQGATKWQLWHTTDSGKKYIDVSVELKFDKGKPKSFICSDSLQPEVARLTREDLDDALRMSICSIDE